MTRDRGVQKKTIDRRWLPLNALRAFEGVKPTSPREVKRFLVIDCNSVLRLNRYFSQFEHWDEATIATRSKLFE